MKLTHIICLGAALFFSCADEETQSRFDNKVFLNAAQPTTTFLVNPDMDEQTELLGAALAKPIDGKTDLTLAVSPALVAQYNLGFYDNAVMLPAENYEIPDLKMSIMPGAVRSNDVEIRFKGLNTLDLEQSYVLPVTISESTVGVLAKQQTHYYVFKQGALINWAADMEKNYAAVDWASVPSSMREITIEGLLYIREIEREGSDSNIMTFIGCETASSAFLIRLGDTFQPGQVMVVAKGSRDKYPAEANNRATVPLNKWFHLAVTLDAQNQLKIYLDGELKSTSTTADRDFTIANDFYIGKSWNDNRYWPGQMCEVRVWDYARSQEEIAGNRYKVNPNSKGLIAYWKFNEGSGNLIHDHSGNGNDVTSYDPLVWQPVSLPEE